MIVDRGLRRAKALDVYRARFRPVTCRALQWDRRGVRQAQIRGAAAAPANHAADSSCTPIWKIFCRERPDLGRQLRPFSRGSVLIVA
jgi:hypothetical protein